MKHRNRLGRFTVILLALCFTCLGISVGLLFMWGVDVLLLEWLQWKQNLVYRGLLLFAFLGGWKLTHLLVQRVEGKFRG